MRRLLALLIAAAPLSGCSQFDALKDVAGSVQGLISGTDNSEPPNELRPLEPSVNLTVLWDADIGKGYAEQVVNLVPAVTDEVVYVADRGGEVQARQRFKGDKLWEVDLELSLTAGPVAAGDRLLVGTDDAELLALSSVDGSVLWKTELSSEILALPRVERDTVVVRTTDGRITALDLRSGGRRWVHERTIPPLSVRGLGSPTIAGELVLDGFGGGKLLALNLADGKTAWESNIAIPHGRSEIERLVEVDADPLVRGNTAYITGHQAGVAAVDLGDGSVQWRHEGVFSSQGLAADRKSLFLSDHVSDVWQLDMRTGGDLWKQTELHQRRLTAPALLKDRLIVGDFEGYLHVLSKDDGSLVGRLRVDDDPIYAQPVVRGDILYVYTSGGTLAAVALE